MICPKCGTQNESDSRFCVNCGTPVCAQPVQVPVSSQVAQPQYAQPQYTQPQQPQPQYAQPQYTQPQYAQPMQTPIYGQPMLSMRWYKFLINFGLFASMVLNFISAIMVFTGAQYDLEPSTLKLLYAFFPDLKTVDILYGLMLFGLMVFAFFTRMFLAGYKKNGPKMLYGLYIAAACVNLFYCIGVSAAVPADEVIGQAVATTIGSIIGSAVMVIVNVIYFKKRANLFVR